MPFLRAFFRERTESEKYLLSFYRLYLYKRLAIRVISRKNVLFFSLHGLLCQRLLCCLGLVT